MEKRKIIYYSDELNDEFSTAEITPKKIDGSYRYIHTSLFKRFTRFFWYRMIFTPLAYLYSKLVFHHRIVNGAVLRTAKKSGYFLYGNHTQAVGDALMPQMLDVTKPKYVIVHPNNVSMPLLGKITPSLGALPLPDDRAALRNFTQAIERRIAEKSGILVFPEAHIWPYYTGIRPFFDASFHYPIKYGVPAFCFTNTYQKRRFSRKPRIVTYVDGPFLPDLSLGQREQRKDLRDRIYRCMCRRAENSNVEVVRYIRREEKHD